MSEEQHLEAYCMKCRTKRLMTDAQPVFTSTGRAATKGICGECGTTMYRMGETPGHEGMERPPITAGERRKRRDGTKRRKRRYKGPREGKLVIVESPAKARTVGRFLGDNYKVRASVGHVRDLLRSKMSVDLENDFKPRYRVPNEKREVVKELQAEVEKTAEVYLATDPDREGEAIAWHLMAAAEIEPEQARRVVFHEITRGAIEEAFLHSREINMELVNAQQARRILDRIVGYSISPLLWERIRNRLTAGRVQSVAVRLIVEREREIQAFVPVEYWSIEAELAKQVPPQKKPPKHRKRFLAKLARIRGEKVELTNEADTQAIVSELEESRYLVTSVKRGTRRRKPPAPFITSSMQQEANRRLGFTARRTMANAQALYEGIPIGPEGGNVGLITYMRTDSTNVAEQAQNEAREFLLQHYGKEYVPEKPPVHKTRAKGAQEAHEAIRPTSVSRTPEAVKEYLSRDQRRLYELIWKRFLASQMTPAVFNTMSVQVSAGILDDQRWQQTPLSPLPQAETEALAPQLPYMFRASGSTLKFAGFLEVYREARDEDATAQQADDDEGKRLPPVEVGEFVDLLQLLPEQHFTQPPPRYTEASLVRTLEEYGIGRPSTYAPIISTIQNRGYVVREDRRLFPTEIAFTVNDQLMKYFPDVLDYGFTAEMEGRLDEIATGDREWVPVLQEFYQPFKAQLEHAHAHMENMNVGEPPTGDMCEKCGHPLVVRYGRYGRFIACSNYPACRNTMSYYEKIGVACPECGSDLVERRTRRGRTFYGCITYPDCEFSVWNRPRPTPCPRCAGLLVEDKKEWVKCTQCEEQFERDKLPEAIAPE
jgi:DNA topoisomerase-1